jgi:hypothetical protein
MSEQAHWVELGIEATADSKTIRKRYAQLLKKIDQRANLDQFQALRQAYEIALNEAAWMAHEQMQRQQEQEAQQDGVSTLSQATEQGQPAQGIIEPIEQTQATGVGGPTTTETLAPTTTHTHAHSHVQAELSLTEQHLERWACDLCLFLNRGDKDLAIEALAQHLRSSLCERREIWLIYQARVIKLCLDEEQSNKPISFTFVKAAAVQFGWFDPERQQDNFNDAALRTIRARILQQAATEVAEKYQTQTLDEAKNFLSTLVKEEYLQGIEERDYFEACLLMQCTELALPLAAIDNISTHLNWDKENSHLWAIAPQECEKFRTRMQLLHKEKDTDDFRTHLHKVANNLPEASNEEKIPKRKWLYALLPGIFCGAFSALIAASAPNTSERLQRFFSVFILLYLVFGGLSWRRYMQDRVLHHPLIDISAVQNLHARYRPLWLRWRAFGYLRQHRTKEWLELIENRYPSIAETMDQGTRNFWKKKLPALRNERVYLFIAMSLPISLINSLVLGESISDHITNPLILSTLVILCFLAFSIAQFYLFAIIPIWCEPSLIKINAFLAKWIVPKRYKHLPQRGMSSILYLVFALTFGGVLTLVSLLFELNIRNSVWITETISLPLSIVVSGWIYLWRFEQNLDHPNDLMPVASSSGFQFQWWHFIVISMALRAIGKAFS